MSAFVDGCFYINLDRRTDRRAEVEAEFRKLGLNVERFPAIERNPGIVGCGLSHLAVLKMAKERGYKNVLIFEDDFELLIGPEEFEGLLGEFFKSSVAYDVVMLGYHIEEKMGFNDLLDKMLAVTTTSAYLVHEGFYQKLIDLYEGAIPKLIETGMHWVYANDQVWKELQPQANWYAFKTRIGKQRGSFSDLSLMWKDNGY